jgi:hypothetical protein
MHAIAKEVITTNKHIFWKPPAVILGETEAIRNLEAEHDIAIPAG